MRWRRGGWHWGAREQEGTDAGKAEAPPSQDRVEERMSQRGRTEYIYISRERNVDARLEGKETQGEWQRGYLRNDSHDRG